MANKPVRLTPEEKRLIQDLRWLDVDHKEVFGIVLKAKQPELVELLKGGTRQ